MALEISTYSDPGVYQIERVVPGTANVSSVPLTVTLLGIANRDKRATNEAVTRGQISNEALTLGVTPGSHTATLINISNRKSAQMTIYKDDVALDSLQVTYMPPTRLGTVLTTLNFTTNNKISLSLDGKMDVTIAITTGGADLTTITGSLITQRLLGLTIGAVTAAQIADGINKALAGATSLGYGSAYGAVATIVVSNAVTITSPTNTSTSNLQLFAAYPAAESQTLAVMGATLPFQAPTVINVNNTSYSGTSTYTATYVSTNTDTDVLVNVNVQSIVRVGSFAGVTSFVENTDYTRSGSTLDFSADAAAVFTSSVASATKDVSVNDSFLLSLDGRASISIDLNALASPPPGYANPASPAAATNAEINININAILANSTVYGPRYATVAGVSSTQLKLTSPNQGLSSSVSIAPSTTLSAATALYGLTSGQMPYTQAGTGLRPTAGAIYFATYEYTRLSSDYNLLKRYFTPDQVYADVGFPTATNALALAAGIAFENNAPSVIVCQVNDSNFPGSPLQSEFLTALNVTNESSSATEICALTTSLPVQVDAMNNIVNNNSPTQKNPRRGWFGMARDTTIGDRDTAGTMVYMATRTLQVPGDSPARGRLVVVAPTNISRDITLADGSVVNVELDSMYVAVAVAAKMTSFTSPAETLLRKTISGFKTEDFQTYLKAERAILASNGCLVVTSDAGKLTLMDPMSTEAGGGRLPAFQELSASTQKDSVVVGMNQSLDANLVGVVPSDLANFILTIKGYVGGVLRAFIAQGAIAPFKTADGVTRDIDFSKDIQVFRDTSDPTKYNFKYFFNLRYPVKRMNGEYSVDSPIL